MEVVERDKEVVGHLILYQGLPTVSVAMNLKSIAMGVNLRVR